MENLVEVAGQYGALGLMLLACFYFINKLNAQDQEERKETVSRLLEQHNHLIGVIEKNSTAIAELSTLIKNKL